MNLEKVIEQQPAARWTNDCQGKKDYDGNLVSISTRYWPRGGGFNILRDGVFKSTAETDPQIRPSAKTSIHINCNEPDENGLNSDYAELASIEFEADTEEEVKALVETWVAASYRRIVSTLLAEYGKADLEIV